MKISSLMFVTNAIQRGDTFIEAIKSHLYFSDELILVDGGSVDGTVEAVKALNDSRIKYTCLPWPEDFSWIEFATHANFGYEHATGDWVVTGESDHIFHEGNKVRETLKKNLNSNVPVISVMKKQTSVVDKFFSKAKIPYFINKKYFGNKIGYGLDRNNFSDLGKPIFIENKISDYYYEGKLIEGKHSALELFNYVWSFKTLDKIIKERTRANKAWNKCPYLTQHFAESENETEVSNCVKQLLLAKLDRSLQYTNEDIYPKIMIDKVKKELKPGMFGYDVCGLIDYKPCFIK